MKLTVNNKMPSNLDASYNRASQFKSLSNPSNQNGFTLIEMMVVMVVLSILASVMALSVSTTDTQKNRAFYEHLINSLSYVRLVSSEQMQPMGLLMQPDNQGQVQPVIVKLTNPFAHLEAEANQAGLSQQSKNSMALSAEILTPSNDQGASKTPTWIVAEGIELPVLPPDVTIEVSALDLSASSVSNANGLTSVLSSSKLSSSELQPWFVGTNVPQALWYGNGEASPARIEIRYNDRLVGDAITLLPDGRISVGE